MPGDSFVLVVEDHPLFKQALDGLLQAGFPDIEVASVGNAGEAFEFLEERQHVLDRSVLVLDPGLPDISFPELVETLRTRFASLATVIVSGSDDPLMVSLCVGAGVKAFISKLVHPDRIVEFVGRALRGDITNAVWLTLDGEMDTDDLRHIQLTSRQLEVLHLVCQGLSNKQIADELKVNEVTVKVHLSGIFKELAVSSRTQAILAAQRLGLRAARA